MSDSRSNNPRERPTSTSGEYNNPFINDDCDSDDAHDHDSPLHQDPAGATVDHASSGSTTTFSSHQQHPSYNSPIIPTNPPSYPTLSMDNPFAASPDVLLGFTPPAQVVADNLAAADATPHPSTLGRLPHSDTYRAVHRPLAPGQSLYDPSVGEARRNAIVGGWVDSQNRETPEPDEGVAKKYAEEDENGKEGKAGSGGKQGDGKVKKTKRGKRGGRKRRNARGGRGGMGGDGGRGGFGGGHGGGFGGGFGGMGGAGMAVY